MFRISLVLSILFCSSLAIAGTPIEEELANIIEDKVRERTGYPDATEISVRSLRPSDKTLLRRTKTLLSVVLPPGETGTGRVTAQVQVLPSGQQQKVATLWVVAQVDIRFPSVMATRAIARGTLLSWDDVKVDAGSNPRALRDPALVVGRLARRSFRQGETITQSMLKLPRVIERGDVVKAYVTGGGFSITASGKSLEHAAMGDVIAIRVFSTEKVIHGRVTGPGSAEVIQ